MEKQIIVPCPSFPCNTPILPVAKADGKTWCLVQIWALQTKLYTRYPVLLNPITILQGIPADSKLYTVIDLTNTFFSIPMHPDSQFWFAFTYNEKKCTWTRLPQGYAESLIFIHQQWEIIWPLSHFHMAAHQFSMWMICSFVPQPKMHALKTPELSLISLLPMATRYLSPKSSQCRRKWFIWVISYLQVNVAFQRNALRPFQMPQNLAQKKEVMSFLGTCSYYRQWQPNFAVIVQTW